MNMKIANKITCLGFILALSVLSTSETQAHTLSNSENLTINSRLSRLTNLMQQNSNQSLFYSDDPSQVAGWANGRRGSWVDGARRSFADRAGGGGFYNRNWPDGGRFYNHHGGGGGFINRR